MNTNGPYTLNVNGRLIDLTCPLIMGVVNLTPDSFYQVQEMYDGDVLTADIIDVGAYSTRPGHGDVSVDEEKERLRMGLAEIRKRVGEDAMISVDTFRSEVARMCVEEYGVGIVNDVSGGMDERMFETVAELGVPYVLTANRAGVNADRSKQGSRRSRGSRSSINADGYSVEADVLWLLERMQRLRSSGQKDIIVDPGFGFGKTLDENYQAMSDLEKYKVLDVPVLVGISRKSMIGGLIGCSPEDSLIGTTVLNTVALLKGADILRVHDVREAREAVKICSKLKI